MTSKVWIYDRAGYLLCQVETVVTRSWRVGDVGQAEFTLALTDPKVTEKNLRFGNLVYITHETLPAWGGVLDSEGGRTWDIGKVTVRAWSAEKLLAWRRGSTKTAISGKPGAVFEKMLSLANQQGDTLIRAGAIYKGGDTRSDVVDMTKLVDEIKRIAAATGMEWSVEPDVQPSNRLLFSANWYAKMGKFEDWALVEGSNCELVDAGLTEQGEIINDLLGIGEGSTADSQITSRQTDAASIALYGLRQGVQSFSGVKVLSTLTTNVKNALKKSAYPRRTWVINVLDAAGGGAGYQYLRKGNTLPFITHSMGFSGGSTGASVRVRIMAMAATDDQGKVPLVVDEVI